MPKWIHDRAMSLKKDMGKTYGPEKAKQVAFAVATQQSHRLGKSPKTFKSKVTGKKERFGTSEARAVAKAKFDRPRGEYQKTAEERVLSAAALLAKSANVQMVPPQLRPSQPQQKLPTPPPTPIGASQMLPERAVSPVGSRPAPSSQPIMKVGSLQSFTDELLAILGQPPLEKDAGLFRAVGDVTEAVAREGIKGLRAPAYYRYVYGGGAKRAKKELGRQLERRLPGLVGRVKKVQQNPTYRIIAEEAARAGKRGHAAGMAAIS